MKNVTSYLPAIFLSVSLMLMSSCSNITEFTETENSKYDVQLLSKIQKQIIDNVAEEAVEDVAIEEIIDEVILDLEDHDFFKSETSCPIKTIENPDQGRYPKIITKDFGEGCTTEWGVEKSGKIIITLYGPWLQEGSKRTITFEDYTHRGIAVSGEKNITCKGLNEDSLYVHVIKGGLTLVKPDSLVVKRAVHKRRILLAGVGQPDVPKEWLIEGKVEVEKSNGISCEVHTRTPLYRIQGCRWFQDGIKVIHIRLHDGEEDKGDGEGEGSDEGRHKVVIDYGYAESEDACDSFVLRTIDDEEPVVVNLKR